VAVGDAIAVGLGRASRGSWICLAAHAARRQQRLRPLATTVGVALSAELVSSSLRRAFGRPRPCLTRPALIRCPHSPSFPSNHSAIAAASAVTLARFEPGWSWPMLALATLVGRSRVRVGVHHPTDVVAGLLLGAAVGLLAEQIGPS
jgi:membrane-associated phospholipid phosphatase